MPKLHLVIDANEDFLDYAYDLVSALEKAHYLANSKRKKIYVMQPNSCVLECNGTFITGSHSDLSPNYSDHIKELRERGVLPDA